MKIMKDGYYWAKTKYGEWEIINLYTDHNGVQEITYFGIEYRHPISALDEYKDFLSIELPSKSDKIRGVK